MDEGFSMIRARFELKFRCSNCRHIMCRELVSPNLEDAPHDIEELVGSALLASQVYSCESCENPVSTLISVRPLASDEALEASKEPERVVTRRAMPANATALQRAIALSATRRRSLG